MLDEASVSPSSFNTSCRTLQIGQMNGHYHQLLVKPNDLLWQLLDSDSMLKLEFSLPASCYATVMMREFLNNV